MTGWVHRATEADIPEMMAPRLSVRENRLLDPSQVTAEECRRYVTHGNMCVRDEDGALIGISTGNGDTGWIWALFVRPSHEGRGIGRALFAAACDALIAAGFRTLRLSTDPDTRAAAFYRTAGRREAGRTPEGEPIFELSVPPA